MTLKIAIKRMVLGRDMAFNEAHCTLAFYAYIGHGLCMVLYL
jgi:hypothetical protein